MATQEKCVEAKKEANSMHEENDVSNRHMTYGRREAVEECGEQPREPRGKRARQNGSQGEKGRHGSKGQRGDKKATPYTLSFTFQP